MSRPKNTVQPKHIVLLRNVLQQAYGKPIRHSVHCEHLSEHINSVLQETVSAQTLRRIFGFISSSFNPSITNLDILARYCGYKNWHDLLDSAEGQSFQPLSSADEAALYLSFYSIDLKDEGDINYHNACRNIAERILTNPVLFSKLAFPLAQHPTSQVFFYERFPFIDGLGSDYIRGIQIYITHKKDKQAQLFGHCLLLLSGILTENRQLVQEHYAAIENEKAEASYHPFLIARLLGSRILYKRFITEEAIESEVQEVYKWSNFFAAPSKIKFWHFPYYQFMLSDYLNLAGLNELSLEILRKIPANSTRQLQAEENYLQALTIILEIAKSSENTKGFIKWKRKYNGWSQVRVLFRNFYRLQVLSAYLSINLKASPLRTSLYKEFNELIMTTGFVFFKRRMH